MLARKFALGLSVGVAALAYSASANATTFHVGDFPNFYLTSGTPFTPSITANFGNGFSTALSFDDSYEFTIPQNGVGSGSISTSFSSARNKLTITGLWINGTSYSVPANSSGQFLAVSGIPILANVLNTIRVTGTTSVDGGTYSGTATFSATAVPEAATWAMMLGGFGMMGFALRRRRTSVSFA